MLNILARLPGMALRRLCSLLGFLCGPSEVVGGPLGIPCGSFGGPMGALGDLWGGRWGLEEVRGAPLGSFGGRFGDPWRSFRRLGVSRASLGVLWLSLGGCLVVRWETFGYLGGFGMLLGSAGESFWGIPNRSFR